MKKWSNSWKGSTKRKKQIKYVKKAPLHKRKNFMTATLSKDLRKKYSRRTLTVRKGDKVKVMRGQFRKTTGKITEVDTQRQKVYIEGVELIKKDGSKAMYPVHPSNIMITEPNMEDRKRKKIVERKGKGAK
ncbi:MAG: 50S ribosomal protein L24 [archaeon]